MCFVAVSTRQTTVRIKVCADSSLLLRPQVVAADKSCRSGYRRLYTIRLHNLVRGSQAAMPPSCRSGGGCTDRRVLFYVDGLGKANRLFRPSGAGRWCRTLHMQLWKLQQSCSSPHWLLFDLQIGLDDDNPDMALFQCFYRYSKS